MTAASARVRAALGAAAGPLLIIALVLVMRADTAFSHRLPLGDLTRLWLPTYSFLGEQLRHGRVPGWDPYLFTGRPFAADPQSGWMYAPPMLLFTLLRPGWALPAMVLLQPVMAGLGMYGLLRAERFGRAPATLGGVGLAGALCSSQFVMALPFSAVFAWTAVTLFLLARAFASDRPWAACIWLGLAALGTGQAAAAHFSLGLVMHLIMVGAYLALQTGRCRGDRAARRTVAAGVPGYLVLVSGLNAAYLLPRLTLLPHTNLADGYAAAWALARSLAGLPFSHAPIGLRAPAAWPLALAVAPGAHLPALLGCALPGALLAARAGKRRGLTAALAGAGLLGYLLSLSLIADAIPVGWRSYRVVDLYLHEPGWFVIVTILCLCGLGVIGVEHLLDMAPASRAPVVVAALAVTAGAALLAGCAPGQLEAFVAGGAASALVLGVARLRGTAAAAVVAIAALELAIGGQLPAADSAGTRGLPQDMHATLPAHGYVDPAPAGATARSLRAAGGRVLLAWPGGGRPREVATGLPSPLNGTLNAPLADDVPAVDGYAALQPRRFWIYTRSLAGPLLDYNRTVVVDPSPTALNLLGVGWVVSAAADPPAVPARAVRRGHGYVLWRLDPPPTAQLYAAWTSVPGSGQARLAVTSAAFDPSRQLVVEGRPAATAGGSAAGSADVSGGPVPPLTISTSAAGPRMLLLRQGYDPYWHATVDGRPAPVLAADLFELGVPVPAGRHTVVLTYDNPWIARGLAVSAVALLAWLATAAALARRSRGTHRRGEMAALGSPQ